MELGRRNDPIEPTRGFDMSLSQDVAGLGGDVNYLRTEGSATWYRGLWEGFRFSSRFAAGYIFPFADDDTVRINNRFFRGGSSFRGFDVAGIGPREIDRVFDSDGNEVRLRRGRALGGNAYYQGTFELTVPNYLPEEYGIKTALFTDVGSLGRLEEADIDDPMSFHRHQHRRRAQCGAVHRGRADRARISRPQRVLGFALRPHPVRFFPDPAEGRV